MEKTLLGRLSQAINPYPFSLLKLIIFPTKGSSLDDRARYLGNSLKSLQMSNILFEIKKLKREIPRQTQAHNAPMPVLTIEHERQERRIN